jgi:predicted Zn-dependent protease
MAYGDSNYSSGAGHQWIARLAPLFLGLVAAAFVFVRGCQPGPGGRWQSVSLNPQQEAQLGTQAFQEVLDKSRVVRSGPVVDAVQGVTRRLITATGNEEYLRLLKLKQPKFDWEVRVVESREVNAFCLPGGKIVVYTGILPVAENDAGLATVLGHEITHAIAHHGAERMKQQEIANIAVGAAGASMGDMDPVQRQQILQAINAGAQFGILSYSRKHESEADKYGLFLMAAAGYDPHESVRFWERMEKISGGGKTPEFASTHPSHATRIRDLKALMPIAERVFEDAGSRAPNHPLPRLTR